MIRYKQTMRLLGDDNLGETDYGKRCKAHTAKGHRCTNTARHGDFCGQHMEYQPQATSWGAQYTCPYCGRSRAIATSVEPDEDGDFTAWCIRCNFVKSKPCFGPTPDAAIQSFKEHCPTTSRGAR